MLPFSEHKRMVLARTQWEPTSAPAGEAADPTGAQLPSDAVSSSRRVTPPGRARSLVGYAQVSR